MILETLEADIRQLELLIRYHKGIAADAKLYSRPTEGALAEFTYKYLKELQEVKEKSNGI